MLNVSGVMASVRRLIEAHQRVTNALAYEATLQLIDAVRGSAGVMIFRDCCEQIKPAGPQVDVVQSHDWQYQLKAEYRQGDEWERVWREIDEC